MIENWTDEGVKGIIRGSVTREQLEAYSVANSFHHPDYQSMSKPDLHTCTETSYLTHGPSLLTRYSYPLSFGKVGLEIALNRPWVNNFELQF